MDIAVISLIIVVIGLFVMPIYSSYMIEWRIKKYAKKFKLEDLIETIRQIADALTDGEEDEGINPFDGTHASKPYEPLVEE